MSHDDMDVESSASKKVDEDILPDLLDKDIGARNPTGPAGMLILVVAVAWSLFQLWIASPFQYHFDFLALNNTETRSIHLAFAMFLTFLVCPAFASSSRKQVPWLDWLLALIAAYCAGYIFLEYNELAKRPGLPTDLDIWVSLAGLVLLLEASRRSLGLALVVIASLCLFYTFAGSWEYIPDIIRHDGQSLNKVANHQWLSSEGVFGIALGVSTSFVFLFVLFGALLEKAGAGNYFIQVAFAMLGHMRGGPAKAAVLSSGLTGLVSGSSIANVVMTGTFTIPLMRRVGFSKEKAGAVEVSSSVNGQIMPPVMGAAAFLMVEYIGIPYIEVVKHAFLPAIISYIALLYIVHLEALKRDMPVLPKRNDRPWLMSLFVYGITFCSLIILSGIVYYGIGWIKDVTPDYALHIVIGGVATAYLGLLWYASRFPELEKDDPKAPIYELPLLAPTLKTGLHYLLPLVILLWCLMVERLSPGLSAFWACFSLIIMLLTQRPLMALFRKSPERVARQMLLSVWDLIDGLQIGARNMVGIAVATAAAGIIVGTVTLTGIGQVMTQVVEIMSGGSFVLVLVFTAVICLVLGMGLPTTANYIVVSSVMVAVIQELGAQHGYYIPLIAIHMFVFYFGIMADVTPPVGLASFAAAAVAGGDPIRTGAQAFLYSCRTVVLPFFFIFNHKLLLIGVDSVLDGVFVFLLYTAAIMIFSAATIGFFITRNRWYESIVLLIVASMIFIPGRWVTLMYPKFEEAPPQQVESVIGQLQEGDQLHLLIRTDDIGIAKEYYAHIRMKGESAEERSENLGLTLSDNAEGVAIVEDMTFNGQAEQAGILFDDEVLAVRRPLVQPPYSVMYYIAGGLLLLVSAAQWHRRNRIRRKARASHHTHSTATSS
jgi:TRAP transporter 4TM/12TM fusion protein